MKRILWLLLVWLVTLAPAAAQPSSPSAMPSNAPSATPAPASPQPTESASPPASTMSDVLGWPEGNDRGVVMLNGLPLLTLRGAPGITAEERAQLLQRRLDDAVRLAGDHPDVKLQRSGHRLVLHANGVYLLEVTDVDAAANQTGTLQLGLEWQETIQKAMEEYVHEQSGAYLHDALLHAGLAILLAVLVSLLSARLAPRYLHVPGSTVGVLAWLSAIDYILLAFAETRVGGVWLWYNVVLPLWLLAGILVASAVIVHWGTTWVDRYFQQVDEMEDVTERPRVRQRIAMVRQAVVITVRTLLVVAAVLIYLGTLHINISALLTGAGLVGVAMGLAGQDLLKDIAAGISIVVEDLYGVHDLIRVGDQQGWVESFTLRATMLRDAEGSVITIPNSMIRVVKNLGSGAHADVSVTIPYSADIGKALALMQAAADALKQDEKWQANVTGDAHMLGVDDVTDARVVLRMLVPTTRAAQMDVRRELLLRIKREFDAQGIEVH